MYLVCSLSAPLNEQSPSPGEKQLPKGKSVTLSHRQEAFSPRLIADQISEIWPLIRSVSQRTNVSVAQQLFFPPDANGLPKSERMLSRALSECPSNSGRLGAPSTPLGSLFQGLTTVTVQKCLLVPHVNLPWCSCVPCPPRAPQGAETGTSLSASPPQEAAGSSQVASWPPFLQRAKCAQPLLTDLWMLRALAFICGCGTEIAQCNVNRKCLPRVQV